MKIRVADYIAGFLADKGINHVFSVVGGGAMYLNNAFVKESRIKKVYNHHEQACAIAAESYSRINNKMAAVCVTSGPGGTNALTGVLCAWQDSLPVFFVSGQVRYDITVESTGLDLRQFGEQEYYIVRSVSPMTKYAVMISDANTIRYHLEKAFYLATNGRRGPVWIDVPLNIQGQIVETDDLIGYSPESLANNETNIEEIVSFIEKAKKPVIIAGSGIRTSGSLVQFSKLAKRLNIPVICPTSTVDYFTYDEEFYYGMFGSFGGRAGNFIVQNADLLLVFGARLSFKQIGFNYKEFSPYSKKVVIDADEEELKKNTVYIDLPIHSDVADVINLLSEEKITTKPETDKWIEYCKFLKNEFPQNEYENVDYITARYFSNKFWNLANEGTIVVLGNNTAAVSMLQCGIQKKDQRLFGNVNCGTMGYDLPAAIGASVASGSEVFCATGEGSMQMNLQELQTMVYNDLPIKIIVFDNNMYQAIVQTHKNFFGGVLAGCTNDSGISFPSLKKIADAYDFGYKAISKATEIEEAVKWIIGFKGRAILDLIQVEADPIVPKLSSKRLENGDMISPSIDDMAPFLSREKYEMCLFDNYCSRNGN